MKRWLACLLTVIMLVLPSASMAEEAYQATLSWTADVEGVKDYLSKMIDMDQASLNTLSTGLVKLISSVQVQLGLQEDGGYWASLSLQDQELLSLSYALLPEGASFVCSLVPGYVMTLPLTEADWADMEALELGLAEVDWEAILSACQQEAIHWVSALPYSFESGSFMGDAYTGGTWRETYRFDDRDVALLLDGLALQLRQCLPDSVLTQESVADMLDAFSSMNHDAALRNQYNYVLHRVEDDQGQAVGYSLLVLENDVQLMTLSLGLGENDLRCVLGFGYQGTNYYAEIDIAKQAETADKTECAVDAALYQDTRLKGLSAAKAEEQGLIMTMANRTAIEAGEGSLTWTLDTTFAYGQSADTLRQLIEGVYEAESSSVRQETALYFSDAYKAFLTETLVIDPAEPNELSTENLIPFRLDEDDFSVLDEVVEDAAGALEIAIFKLIPAELLTFLMNVGY